MQPLGELDREHGLKFQQHLDNMAVPIHQYIQPYHYYWNGPDVGQNQLMDEEQLFKTEPK